ncbi:site-specific integrase [Thioclava sp. BHET1]|nr:site-specific integrase [Thioclava sp. BHET1]
MASITKHSSGWRAQVARQGIRRSKIFPTKREAQDWASRAEFEIVNAKSIAEKSTLGEVMDRYAREVSPAKRGHRWEAIRLEKIGRDRLAKISMDRLTPGDFADWRDRRLREVQAGSVIREMNLISSVLSQARREWGMLSENPMRDVRRPAQPKRRTRLVGERELERLKHSAGADLSTATARALQAFMFAMETGMRAGEIVGLSWDLVDIQRRVAHLPKTKNGEARDVPLSKEAIRLLEELPQLDPVFGLRSDQLDALWRKLRARAAITDLTFHDSRHHAVTKLSKKLDVLALARMIGHRDIKMLMRYYDETAEELAKRLD